ncbi:MAG: c-type cytochrome biogenesis protein CcmI [Pseudomonadota bacterium]
MLWFIAIAGGTALITGILLVVPMLRGGSTAPARAAFDAALYRDQLAEIDRDLDRGTISAAEAEGAKAEISRRLLHAAGEAEAAGGVGTGPRMTSGMVAGLSVLAVPLAAAALYLINGAPGAPDMPYAARPDPQMAAAQATQLGGAGGRPSQAQAEASTPEQPPAETDPEYARLIERLEQRLEGMPEDVAGLRLLAQGYMRLERHREARAILQRLTGLLGPGSDAELYATLAEAMVLAAGGYVSPEAEQALGQALERDPDNQIARFYAGLSLAQNSMIGEAIEVWERLKRDAPPDAPWMPWLDDMLARATELRDRGRPPEGPTEEQIAAAEAMTEDERNQAINTMVQGLEDRLLTEGGTPAKWNQLINSYMFLDRQEDAQRIAGIARGRLSGSARATVEAEIARLGLDGGDPGGLAAAPAPAPNPTPGPTQEDIAAASEMTADQRQEMIRAMVDNLADRLETEGGSAEEWYRLMNSNVVLGEMDRAREVYAKSQTALKGQDAGFVREQALILGVIEE